MATIKHYLLTFFLSVNVAMTYAHQCGNCKITPSIALYDLDVQVTQPELKGEKTAGNERRRNYTTNYFLK